MNLYFVFNENGILRDINHLTFLLSFPQCPHFIPEIISQSNALRQQQQKTIEKKTRIVSRKLQMATHFRKRRVAPLHKPMLYAHTIQIYQSPMESNRTNLQLCLDLGR